MAVLVTALAVPLMRHDADPPRPQPAPAASPPRPAVSPPLPAGWERTMWTPVPLFSLRPAWVPADLGTRPEVFQMGHNELLRYEKDGAVLTAEVGTADPGSEVETPEEHTADVNGIRATVRTADSYDGAKPGDRYVAVRWRMPSPGDWVQVTSFGRHTEAEVLRFARGLDPGTGPIMGASRSPFMFGVLPPRVTTQYQSPDQVCLVEETRPQQRQPDGLCVLVSAEAFTPAGTASG
ncbi:hypothetical protein [Actinoplanes sp. CA-252034]|uniref:hypothetical protein n=1 Tax=Actinoplanes sp. CA-252034 TaxID=3239906 RepID=UPI003D99B684